MSRSQFCGAASGACRGGVPYRPRRRKGRDDRHPDVPPALAPPAPDMAEEPQFGLHEMEDKPMDSIEKIITVPVVETIAPISGQIWNDKYRLKSPDGEPVDQSIEQTWNRVARCLASVEDLDQEMWVQRFEAVQQDFAFMPAGRIIAGAGTDRRVTLFNCFVMGEIEDDMASIFEHLKQAALTMQAGGGNRLRFLAASSQGRNR